MELISAISTARGTGGVAIIRVSGDGALNLAEKMFTPRGKTQVADFEPYKMYTGDIMCDGFTDHGLCVYFKAPRSFTGEDVVEFHCHGGARITEGVLKKTFSLGARPAVGGEFTKRAFLNGKLSLASAEGLADMINAQSFAQLKAGNMLYLKKPIAIVERVQSSLKFILASIAADCDYPEEGVADSEIGNLKQKLQPLLDDINSLIATYPRGKCIKNGVSVALCGKPNVGKSSLLNALLGYDRAIVSDEAGTTRDAVEGKIEIGGIAFDITDTAGLREGAGAVENQGIRIAKNVIAGADIVVYVSDGSGEEIPDCPNAKLIRVFNKADIYEAPQGFDAVISAATGYGMDNLKNLLLAAVPSYSAADGAVICEERHMNALAKASDYLRSAIDGAEKFPLDIVGLDINGAWQALGEITGETANESIIDEVFSKFCVGK